MALVSGNFTATPKRDRWPLGPFLLIVFGLAFAVALNMGFTYWAIGTHSRRACTELQIIATSGGTKTPYDKTIKREYERLYVLRCR